MQPTLDVLEVPMTNKPGYNIDPITVFWRNWEPGKGEVTIICYGDAWTAYFGAMGPSRKIQQFFAEAGRDYLVGKLTSNLHRKAKHVEMYLGRIVDAVKEQLKGPRFEV